MDRVNRILEHPLWKECIKQNEMAEANRSFCHHDIEHLCAVGRIAMLLNLEEGHGVAKDIIYATAFLHDCGRFKQYLEGIPHDEAGAEIAKQILPECGYHEDEINCIVNAIASHRGSVDKTREGALAQLLYRADKMSRNCRVCKMYAKCNWPEELKGQRFYW